MRRWCPRAALGALALATLACSGGAGGGAGTTGVPASPTGAPTLASTTTTTTTTPPATTTTTTTTPTTTTTTATTTTATTTPTTLPTTASPAGPSALVRTLPGVGHAVSLSFDAGSDRGHAALILDTLAAEGITASFGLTGDWAAANDDLVARIAAEGHTIVNHTANHRSFTGLSTGSAPLSPAARLAELQEADDIIAAVTGHTTKPWFRPPYGDYDTSVLADVGAAGYAYTVLWALDSGGWRGWDADTITANCLANASDGAIVLFHVGASSQDAQALPAVIAGLRAAGYDFVPLTAIAP